jgi:uncharacterized membrane protein HdeD (DUF308 family)
MRNYTPCISRHLRKGEKIMSTQGITDTIKEATGMSIGMAVALIVLGFLAVLLPFAAGIGLSILVGWIVVFSGFAHMAYAFTAKGAGAFLWRTLVGIAYVIGGLYLAFHPGIALVSLTLLIAAIFLAEGVLELVLFFQFRALPGSGWLLFDGVVTMLLAYVIWRPWRISSTWVIGTIVGVNLIMSGFTRLMYSVAARKTIKAIA